MFLRIARALPGAIPSARAKPVGRYCSIQTNIQQYYPIPPRLQLGIVSFPFIFHPLDYDCPADGLCSNQGLCDVSNGNCICDAGFEGITCQGNYGKVVILPL